MTPLHIAASAGQLEIGIFLQVRVVIANCSLRVVKFLVSRGARLEARDDVSWSFVLFQGDTDCAEYVDPASLRCFY